MSTSNGSIRDRDGVSAVGSQLIDPNANSTTLSTSNGLTTATDALGRTIYTTTIPIGKAGAIPAGTYYVTTYSATGSAESYKVIFSSIPISNFHMPHPTSSEIASAVYCTLCNSYSTVNDPSSSDSLTGVTEIDLPDTTSKYLFSYDQTYGTISQVTFPTGGHVRFAWNIRDKDWSPYGQFEAISAVVVTDAYVSDGSGENHWSYTPESLSTSSTPIGEVIAPDSSKTEYTGTCLVYTVVPFYAYQAKASCKEASHANYSASGTLLASVAETFTSHGLPVQIVTSTYDSTATSQNGPKPPLQKQAVNYYDSYDNVTEKDESDYFSCTPASNGICPVPAQTTGPWLRKTFISFATGLAAVDLPAQVTVTDGTGAPYSLVNYSYDPNGNLQLNKKCLSISNTGSSSACASGSSPWQTQYTYDSHGQMLTMTEGYQTSLAATTTNTWGDASGGNSNTNYLISVSHPNSANAVDYYTYSPYTGQVESHTDWNNNQTLYSYLDPGSGNPDLLNRLRTITAPKTTDGTPGAGGLFSGVTTYTYVDTPDAFSIQEQHKVNSLSTTTSNTAYFDGLGRKKTTKTVTPQCSTPIEVDTVYDSMGRVYTVSTPYCSTSDATYGVTTFTYDGLGRKIQVKAPDSTVSTITYGANATESTNPSNGTTNPQRIQQVDGIGRQVNVCEVSGATFGSASPSSCGLNVSGSGYLTSYAYDPLGNLLNVSQQGVSRSFIYDKLSRLTSATNPETGSVTYVYSTPSTPCAPNPAVPCSKTDARSVTISYGYDSLSRLLSKTYSSNGGSTPSSCYQYDTSSISGASTHLLGYLTNAWTQATSSGSCNSAPSSFINLKSFLSYDAVGRLLNAQQQTCIGGKCSGPSAYQVNMTYDLSGNVTTLTNSVGANNQPLTLTNYFDSASRPCLTTSSWASTASPNIFQINPAVSSASPGYSSAGGLQNYFLGSTASTAENSCSSTPASPINVTLNYTKRFWVSAISATGQIP